MTYIKINDTLYPAFISGRNEDREWDNRESKAITLEMSYADAMALFADDLDWAIVYQGDSYVDENGDTVTPEAEVYDNSEFSVAGPVTDNRNGTVTVKMGKITAEEALTELMEVLADEA